MIFPGSSLLRKFLADPRVWGALLCFFLLGACAADETIGRHHKGQRAISSKFEWAVQHYEAGAYKDSLKNFLLLRGKGTEVPGYDLIPFYVGMSLFHLSRFEEAARELETFLRSGSARQEALDARLSLLLTLEKLGRWKEASSLAAETDKLTLFQNNRALLKLVWARALREQGEILGAKAVLKDSLPYLDKMEADERGPLRTDPDQDLWGRYHFIEALIDETECTKAGPSSTRRKKTLYSPWLESVTDCFRGAITKASEELFSRESPWSSLAQESLERGISHFAEEIDGYLQKEKAKLESFRTLQKASREQLYRILGTTDSQLKTLKDRGINPLPLESLRKLLDRLLVTLSRPSSLLSPQGA
jgi:hypothetical protein